MLFAPVFYVFFYFDSVVEFIGEKSALIMVVSVIGVVVAWVTAYWIHNKKLVLKLINFKTNIEMVVVHMENPIRGDRDRDRDTDYTHHGFSITESIGESSASEVTAA